MGPSSEPLSPPTITATSFFISAGICLGTCLLLHTLYRFAIYIKRRIRGPNERYCRKLGHLILDMKRVIHLGETTENLCPEMYNGNFGIRDHILYLFKHIDRIPLKGEWPTSADWGEEGQLPQALVDLSWGVEVEAIQPPAPLASPSNRRLFDWSFH